MPRPKGSKNGCYTLVSLTCNRCGTIFKVKPSAVKTAVFCSRACCHPPRDQVACVGCGKHYLPDPSTRGVFCSQACMKSRVEKTCPECGRIFTLKVSKAAKFKFCSLGCRRTALSRTQTVISCRQCGKPVRRAHRRPVAVYCSRKCRDEHHNQMIVCAFCGCSKKLEANRARSQRFCSVRCGVLSRMQAGWAPGYIDWKLRTGHRTDIEALTEGVLQRLQITYLFEHKAGRFLIDFALPDWNIALECDGWHHNTAKGREHDRKKDHSLRAQGWTVIRVPDSLIRADATAAIITALRSHVPNLPPISEVQPCAY